VIRVHRAVLCVAALVLMAAAPARAQGERAPARRAQAGEPQAAAERQLRLRIAQLVQKRLNLTPEQLRRLGEVNQRYEPQLQETFQRERRIRLQLQAELTGPDSAANQQLVERLMGEFIKVQRDRLDLVERENRDLASFLSPVQRVKLFEMREQIRRRLEEQRRNGRARRQGGAPPPAPALPF
jgi:periplasmic protein CpxP/Spy